MMRSYVASAVCNFLSLMSGYSYQTDAFAKNLTRNVQAMLVTRLVSSVRGHPYQERQQFLYIPSLKYCQMQGDI